MHGCCSIDPCSKLVYEREQRFHPQMDALTMVLCSAVPELPYVEFTVYSAGTATIEVCFRYRQYVDLFVYSRST